MKYCILVSINNSNSPRQVGVHNINSSFFSFSFFPTAPFVGAKSDRGTSIGPGMVELTTSSY